MTEQLQAEIEAIRSQIQALQQERQQIGVDEVTPENDSPEAIASAHRRYAREKAQVSVELRGIDDAIAALVNQLQQKQSELAQVANYSPRLQIQQQVEIAQMQAQAHAERINQLADELVKELQALKALTYDLSPMYWQVYNKPFLTGFQSTSVPYVRSDGEVWRVAKRVV
ncbi:hypothetical protein H6G20_24315 [Desertifilum sp. FACHB-1129]|uniref:Uncharacterized protein n=2 Tax=Desertifilum tharense IPPAS B-1220 TaxID=1781255 RepID=A0A1E5QG07_9CYAN|nr:MULTISPECIES: hypothetical protein [Cyanophyceae]MCD8489533.1 hypothetical protein [Desertifilum sp.]MDA0210627.1 hypothetical protein [Cyanobacteria bacterium FC1]MBD2314798.1 hypothetical protein [Desertifilum sp. FACHB-1129]MBD2323203.1 hypothetical protein [Desertifilum sp. FACHB-866]MBD2333048.1 hypothetical protein [Desertifilum sp. FACHB-868]